MYRSEPRSGLRWATAMLVVIGALSTPAVRAADPTTVISEGPFNLRSHPSDLSPSDDKLPSVFPGPSTDPPASSGVGVPPRVGPNLEITDPQLPFPDGILGRSDTNLAAALGGLVVVAGWNDGDGFCGPPWNAACTPPPTPGRSGYGVSTDGGRTFEDLGAPFVGTRIGFGPGAAGTSATGRYVTGGDPSLDAGGPAGRTIYFANLGYFEDLPTPHAGISVHIGSVDLAGRFSFDDAVLLQSPDYPLDELDKEHVAADRRPGGDLVTVTVTNFKEVGGYPRFGLGQIEAYTSTDGGSTWSRSIVQPDETVSAAGHDGAVNQGSEPVIGPDGTFYVAWQRGFLSPFFSQGILGVWPEIRVSHSLDEGATWQPAAAYPPGSGLNPAGVLVAPICAGDLFPPSGYLRRGEDQVQNSNTWPRTAVARSGPWRGRVYVAWQDCRIANGGPMPAPLGPEDFFGFDIGHPDTDVYVAYSDDHGVTWTDPILVAGGGDGLIQFWPAISIGPSGAIDVVYSESYEPDGTAYAGLSKGRSLVDVYWARSTDGGDSFGPPVRITEETTDWRATYSNLLPNFGDYNDALTIGEDLLTTWADGRSGVTSVYFARAQGRDGGTGPGAGN